MIIQFINHKNYFLQKWPCLKYLKLKQDFITCTYNCWLDSCSILPWLILYLQQDKHQVFYKIVYYWILITSDCKWLIHIKKFLYHGLCLSEISFLRNTVPLLKLGIHCLWNENSKPPPMFYKYKPVNFNNVWLDKNSTAVLFFRCMDKLDYSLN